MTTSTTLAEKAKIAAADQLAAAIAHAGPRDWPEDFHHDNGQYLNTCVECIEVFTGHKRRVVCKECAKP